MLSGDDLGVQLFIFGVAVSVTALAISQSGWTQKAFVVSLFIFALATFVVGLSWPLIKRHAPELNVLLSSISRSSSSWFSLLACTVIIVGVMNFYASWRKTSLNIPFTETGLIFRFSGKLEQPEASGLRNIQNWFTYWSASMQMKDAQTGNVLAAVPASWAIFLTFDKPTSYRDVQVRFFANRPDTYEVRQTGFKSLVITVIGQIPACEMQISLIR